MRQLIGFGTPRGLQGRLSAVLAALLMLIRPLWASVPRHWSPARGFSRLDHPSIAGDVIPRISARELGFTTGC